MGWAPRTWRLRTRSVDTADHTLVMGIVNVTPDSFSDGGAFTDVGDGAVDHGGIFKSKSCGRFKSDK